MKRFYKKRTTSDDDVIISVKVSKQMAKLVDAAWINGGYANRSSFMRDLILIYCCEKNKEHTD